MKSRLEGRLMMILSAIGLSVADRHQHFYNLLSLADILVPP